MKTRALLLMTAVILMSCEILIVDPVFDERDRITGTYRVEEFSQTYNEYGTFNIQIRKSFNNYNEVIVENFYNANIDVRAEVVDGTIYISRQLVNGYEVDGVGTVYYDEIRFTYRVRDTYYNKPADFCEATAWEY